MKKKSDVKVTKEKMINEVIGLVIETKNVRLSLSLNSKNDRIVISSWDSKFGELWVTDVKEYHPITIGDYILLEKK